MAYIFSLCMHPPMLVSFSFRAGGHNHSFAILIMRYVLSPGKYFAKMFSFNAISR